MNVDTVEAPAGGPTAGPAEALVVEVAGLQKAFGSTRALQDATFGVRPGEVHALVGENGSGKSTLVKILSGVHQPDGGELRLGGETRRFFRSPREAQEAGVVTVFQEVLTIDARSVLENLWIGHERWRGTPGVAERRRLATAVLTELLDRPPRLDDLAEELSLSDRQALGIARAILRRPRVLILDEATSALDYDTRRRLFEVVGRLSAEGTGVVLITHRMDEIDEIGDRVTVMRSGRTVAVVERGGWTTATLVQLMTGEERLVPEGDVPARSVRTAGAPLVSLRSVRLEPERTPFSVTLRAGEIVGVAGLEGHGQDAFVRAIRDATAADGTFERIVDGVGTVIRGRREAVRAGIAYVPRDRRTESIFDWMSIRENFGVPTLRRDAPGGLVRAKHTSARLADYVGSLKIKLGHDRDAITTLSGGNQQKVLIARWLAAEPKVLVLNDPTRGIDINAKRDLYGELHLLAEAGMCIVMLSSEVDEHIELMDRVLVFREFGLDAELPGAGLTRETLVASFFGGAAGTEETA